MAHYCAFSRFTLMDDSALAIDVFHRRGMDVKFLLVLCISLRTISVSYKILGLVLNNSDSYNRSKKGRNSLFQ